MQGVTFDMPLVAFRCFVSLMTNSLETSSKQGEDNFREMTWEERLVILRALDEYLWDDQPPYVTLKVIKV